MKICPCCGAKTANSQHAALRSACLSCGAHPVGEPLPRPAHELPSYARSLVLTVTGSLMVLVFLTQTVLAMAETSTRGAKSTLAAFSMIPTDWRPWLAAGETAAWRLKWLMIPLTLFVVFACRKLYRSVKQSPENFCGLRYARRGYAAAVAVPFLVLVLIGVTVPERLRQRRDGLEAGVKAQGYAMDRLFREYREKFGGLPSEKGDLTLLPDPDGSIAALLKESDAAEYKPSAEVAVVPQQNPRPLRGAVIRNASLTTDEPVTERLTFTNYELQLPGLDKLKNTEDDLFIIDGVTYRTNELPKRAGITTPATQKNRP